MKTHKLKLNIDFCDAVLSGAKTFEIRKNDRDFKMGDLIEFKPVDNDGEEGYHEIENHIYRITYVLSGWGLKDNYVVLAIKEETDEEKTLREQHFYNELCQNCIYWDWCEHKCVGDYGTSENCEEYDFIPLSYY